ncbi:MAG: hypothetical protein JNK11_01370, partial [Alphaproteobacteria bacterium]|nr:hypothetical protein [Alphaproteobacteria bacterium]
TVNLSLGQATDLGGSADTLVSIENVDGSDVDDTLIGGSAGNMLMGGNGTDSIDGAGGDDWLQGGAGPDSIDGGLGNDTADYSQSSGLVGVDLANGVATGGEASGDVLANIEHVQGSNFSDLLRGDGQGNRLLGASGDDSLSGGLGADTLDGGAGDDVLHLDSAADPDDQFIGGNGTDGLVFDAGSVGLDLTGLANGAVQGIERFDLTNGTHTLTLDASDVLSGSTATNASAGDPSYLTWVVDAAANDGDVVQLVISGGSWASNGSFGSYDVWEHAGMGAKVLVDSNVTVNVIGI